MTHGAHAQRIANSVSGSKKCAYLPTDAEAARARAVVEAAAAHTEGAFALDGVFVDAPIVAAAQQLVELADRRGTSDA